MEKSYVCFFVKKALFFIFLCRSRPLDFRDEGALLIFRGECSWARCCPDLLVSTAEEGLNDPGAFVSGVLLLILHMG